jgi:hypothetical protein
MVKLIWDKTDEKFYEQGIDRGVLYSSNGDVVPWNGLISIIESFENDSVEALYYDGNKYIDLPVIGDYSAKLQAVTYPDEFLQFEGASELSNGLYIDGQSQNLFSLSYRSIIKNGVGSDDYRIHVLYNLMAIPETSVYETISDKPKPTLFTWTISGIPSTVLNFKPTAHLILDSRYMNKFKFRDVETILYGSDMLSPELPSLQEFSEYVSDWNLITITDHGDGTWSAEGPDELIKMIDSTTFEISDVDATFIDSNTYQISTTKV